MEISEERPSKMRKLSENGDRGENTDGETVPQFMSDLPLSHETVDKPVTKQVTENILQSGEINNVAEDTPDINSDIITPVSGSQPANLSGEETQHMSKSQLKKLRKKEERAAGRDAWKAEKRLKDKEKKERKKAERAAAAATAPPQPALLNERKQKHQRPVQVPMTLLLDCDFDELMTDKEIASLSSQLTRCYSENRGGRFRSHIVLSSLRGQLKERFETVLSSNHLGWKGVTFTDHDFVEAAEEAHGIMYGRQGGKVAGALASKQHQNNQAASDEANIEATEAVFENKPPEIEEPIQMTGQDTTPETLKDEAETQEHKMEPVKIRPGADMISAPSPTQPSVVYLSSDSPNTLEALSPYTTYIIGGLVDKNRHKGICYKRARERSIPTAKLPIGEYMEMQSRTVLATNHVVEIMVKWLELGDWGKAFLQVIPKRKEAKLREKGDSTKKKDEDQEPQDEADSFTAQVQVDSLPVESTPLENQ